MKWVVLISLFLMGNVLWGQEIPKVEPGVFSEEERAMKFCAFDSSAKAIMLLNKIEYEWRNNLMRETVHKRIKFFDNSIIEEYGNITIPLEEWYGLKNTKISVFDPEKNTIYTYDEKDFFMISEDGYYLYTFAVPKLKKGCILDIFYYGKGAHFYTTWNFQEDIPSVYSEFKIKNSVPLLTKINTPQGFSKKVDSNYHTVFTKGTTKLIQRDRFFSAWNVPSKPNPEPYADYSKSQNLSILITYTNSYLTNSLLVQSERFAEQAKNINNYRKTYEAAKHIINKNISKKEKVLELYNFVNQHMDETSIRVFPEYTTVDQAFQAKRGNSADLNTMLLTLLHAANIQSIPIYTRVRSKGRPIELDSWSLEQFSLFVLQVTIDNNESIFVDCGNPLRPLGLIRLEALNFRGYTTPIHSSTNWIDIPFPKGVDNLLFDLVILEDGSIKGALKGKYDGYNAMPERSLVNEHNKKPIHWSRRLERISPTASVSDYSFENLKEINKPFFDNLNLEIENATTVSGNRIYCSPVLYSSFLESPFQTKERYYDIDFNYFVKENLIIKIKPPEGYIIEELPRGLNVQMKGGGLSYSYQINEIGDGSAQIISKFEIKKAHFPVSEYKDLREVFSIMQEKLNEQIIFIKQP